MDCWPRPPCSFVLQGALLGLMQCILIWPDLFNFPSMLRRESCSRGGCWRDTGRSTGPHGSKGLLPGYGNALALAFFTRCTNNLFFAPIHSALMRVCGNYGEIRFLEGRHITPRQAVDSVDWGELVDFTLFKTIPLFWIPINTVGFLLPQEYRIVFAAVLSLVFGILMTILKLRERKNQSRKESLV